MSVTENKMLPQYRSVFRINDGQRQALWSKARFANTFFTRLVGLLGKTALAPDEALAIEPCSSVHTIGMRMSIDIIFVDRVGIVKKISRNVRPFRFVGCSGCHTVIETAANCRHTEMLAVGDELTWR